MVGLGALADLVTVGPKSTWKTSWRRKKVVFLRTALHLKAMKPEVNVPVALTLLAAASHEARGTTALPGDVMAGSSPRTAAALLAVFPVAARQTC